MGDQFNQRILDRLRGIENQNATILDYVKQIHQEQRQDRNIARYYERTLVQGEQMAQADIDRLTASVEQTKTVDASIVQLLTNVKSQLDAALAAQAAGDDGAALRALSDTLDQANADAAAAVVANTPAAPPTPPADGSVAAGTPTGI